MMCTDVRIVLCEVCGSEGRIYTPSYCFDEYGNHMDYVHDCPWCEATGGELIKVYPIEMDDLDAMAGAS